MALDKPKAVFILGQILGQLTPFGMIFGYQITWGNEHDRHEFYQFSDLAHHQRGSIRNLALSLQILRNAWTLVIRLEGCRGMDWCLARLTNLWALA